MLNQNRRSYFYNNLINYGIPVETRKITLGDIQFILRNNQSIQFLSFLILDEQQEYMMDFIIERKSIEDLESSILDGRYASMNSFWLYSFKEQKSRLQKCGITNVFYLIEGEITSQEVMTKSSLYQQMLSILVYYSVILSRWRCMISFMCFKAPPQMRVFAF